MSGFVTATTNAEEQGNSNDVNDTNNNANNTTQQKKEPSWYINATKSQFDYENGRSACVAIACEAAVRILKICGNNEIIEKEDFKPEVLIEAMENGINMYKSVGRRGHLDLDDVIFSQQYSSQLSLCKREQKCLKDGLEHMLFFELLGYVTRKHCNNAPTALLFVKGGEAALVVISNNGKQILLFNSHPKSELNMNFSKCFIYSVDDIHMAAGFLCQLFPCVTGLGYGLQADMYNMFDVAIVKLSNDMTEADRKEDNVPVAQQLQQMQHGGSGTTNVNTNNGNDVQLTPDLQALVSQGIISREAAIGMM